MYKKIEGQDKVVYVELLHSIGRKGQEHVVYTISKKKKVQDMISSWLFPITNPQVLYIAQRYCTYFDISKVQFPNPKRRKP